MGFVLLYVCQEKFIFLDEELPQDYSFESNIPFEEIILLAQDEGRLNALYFKADSSQGVILYFHGNRGNLTRWADIAAPMTEYGYDVLVMDYRGFGKSTGKRNQANLLADAELFIAGVRSDTKRRSDHPLWKIIRYRLSLLCSW